MIPESFRSEVLAVTERQTDRSDDELLALLEYEWERAGLAVGVRGPVGDYLRSVASSIARQMASQRVAVEVIAAMAADDTLRWAAERDLASERYAIAVGLLAVFVTRAALRRSGDKDDDSDKDDG